MPKFTQPPKQNRVQKKKKITPANSIKKPAKKPDPASGGLYLRGLDLTKRFGCGHVGCSHMGAIEDKVKSHMRKCPMRDPAPEEVS